MKEKLMQFYLRDSRSNSGANAVFHRVDSKGYSSDLSEAEVLTFEEAQKGYNNRETDVPLAKELVDELTIGKVDMQVLNPTKEVDPNGEYLIVEDGMYDGNDVFFVVKNGYSQVNVNLAYTFTTLELREYGKGYTAYPKSYVLKLVRQTFNASKINLRKMTTAYGIIKPKPRKGGKSGNKLNCGICGKFMSEHDYYTYELGCKNCKD